MDNAENNLKKLISLIGKALYPPPLFWEFLFAATFRPKLRSLKINYH